MSDPATPAAPAPVVSAEPVAPAPIAPAVVTEVDIPADGGFPAPDPDPVPAAAAVDPEPKPAEPPVIKKNAFQSRIDTLTAQRTAAEKRAEDAQRQADLYKAMVDGKAADPDADPANPAPTPVAKPAFANQEEFRTAVAAEAVRLAAEETAKARTGKLLASGNADFKDFTDRCNVVASLGAGDRPDFMQIVTDPDVISDGHKVIAQLAENPDEAARILALPTVQMTAALVKFQAEGAKAAPRPLSAAPAPIKTLDAISKTNDEPSDKDSMADYARKYQAKQAEKLKSGQPARFARH